MYTNPQKINDSETIELRKKAGRWLKQRREERDLSQRQLAEILGLEYYTFVSQLETGRGRIPPERYRDWAEALGLPPKDFVLELMRYYDPITFGILFGDEGETGSRARII
jgi:transcriptional regulator with XRE-family HTH domain